MLVAESQGTMTTDVVEEIEIEVKRKTVRFTIDFDAGQHRFLKTYATENRLQSALVIRSLVYLLEIDEAVANTVVDDLFDFKTRTKVKQKTVRFTIDFDAEQHRFLKLFSLESGVQAALIIRALVNLLETNESISAAVLEAIFGPGDDEDY